MPNNKDNQHCLNCASFQPYEDANPVQCSNGECRRIPQIGPAGGYPIHLNTEWPYIADGDNFWCAQWKLSRLPAIESTGITQPVFPGDWQDYQASPWNRREALNQSCWSCNNYQHEDPDNYDDGQCRFLPVPSIINQSLSLIPTALQPSKYIYKGVNYFCSCWERNTGTVPPVPVPIAKKRDLAKDISLVPPKPEAKGSEKKP